MANHGHEISAMEAINEDEVSTEDDDRPPRRPLPGLRAQDGRRRGAPAELRIERVQRQFSARIKRG